MSASLHSKIRNLQRACNSVFDAHLICNRSQFYSAQQNRPITIWVIKKAIYNDSKSKFVYEELFSSASDIQAVKFLRDYWFELNGWEVPTDDKEWNKVKEKYYAKKKNWHDVDYAVQ